MIFNSLTFAVFFLIVTGLYYGVVKAWNGRKNLLLVASYLFYAAWNPPFVLLLMASTVLDWWLGRRIAATEAPGRRKQLLILSLIANLSILGYFKYGNFLLHNFQALMVGLGIDYQPPALDIVLPVGISFYTFQSLSYTIDAYRGRVDGRVSFRDYALFVSFFPQLVAGPIVLATDFLPQLKTPRQATPTQFRIGLLLMLFGICQKLILADTLFAPTADLVYSAAANYSTLAWWTGVFAFSGQIYCDFSGYSLCAIGAALCFGFRLPDNFDNPYAARGITDFWRRWHLSLSHWLRDYLYISLGGNRLGRWKTYRNLMLTMLIGGLWHGASWNFVIWGGLHGLLLAVERAFGEAGFALSQRRSADIALRVLTFVLVSLIWIPFRAADFPTSALALNALFGSGGNLELSSSAMLKVLLGMGLLVLWQLWHRRQRWTLTLSAWPPWVQAVLVALCLGILFLCSGGDERAFIYFQF